MLMSKKVLMNTMVILTIAMIGLVIVCPIEFKMMLIFSMPLMWLLFGGIYYFQIKYAIEKCKTYEQTNNYTAELQLLKKMEAKGYVNFVLDSYRIYALYFLGNFYDYETASIRMSKDRAWKRPIHQSLKDKVVDNICCIHLLRTYQKTGEFQYFGRNLVILDALEDKQNHNEERIQLRLKENPELPILKKAVLYILLRQYEQAAALYPEGSEANRLFLSMKGERKKNGKSIKK